MIPAIVLISLFLICLVLLFFLQKGKARGDDRQRLAELQRHSENLIDLSYNQQDHLNWQENSSAFSSFRDRLGRAGFISSEERRKARLLASTIIGAAAGSGLWLGALSSHQAGLLGLIAGAYLGATFWLYYLKYRCGEFEREMLFQLPLSLEAIILLVESGLGVLPAIERMVSAKMAGAANKEKDVDPATRVFHLVYQMAAHGMPFGRALELAADCLDIRALRHVLLHLDITSSEGGELIPALRSLSEHAHSEWRLSVETRVNRLENFVVFPVFLAVIGLMVLVVSVPIVPVLDFMNTLDGRNSVSLERPSLVENNVNGRDTGQSRGMR